MWITPLPNPDEFPDSAVYAQVFCDRSVEEKESVTKLLGAVFAAAFLLFIWGLIAYHFKVETIRLESMAHQFYFCSPSDFTICVKLNSKQAEEFETTIYDP